MSTEQEELITEQDAARYLQVSPQRLRELAAQGMLQSVSVQVPGGSMMMYYRGEVFRLKERLRGRETETGTEEWPEVIDG